MACDDLAGAVSSALGATGSAYERIPVDDGWSDRTWPTIEQPCCFDPRVVGTDLRRNFGQDNATLTGLRAARGRLVAVMDDDLQHDPAGAAGPPRAAGARRHPLGRRLRGLPVEAAGGLEGPRELVQRQGRGMRAGREKVVVLDPRGGWSH